MICRERLFLCDLRNELRVSVPAHPCCVSVVASRAARQGEMSVLCYLPGAQFGILGADRLLVGTDDLRGNQM